MNGGKIVADDVDGGVICEQYCGVRRKHRRKIIDKNREKSRTKYRALRNTRGREARGRVRVGDTSDMATIGKIRTKPGNSRSREAKVRKLRQQKFVADSVKGLGDVEKDNSN